jgi:hypothetical protein
VIGWAVIEQFDDDGNHVAYHVMPTAVIDGEDVWTHKVSSDCECGPISEVNKHGATIWTHHDPESPGALSEEEWKEKAEQL